MLKRFKWKYSWRMLAGDTMGGLIAALIAIPYGLAMATLMGLPPALGLFTSVITAPITALLGRNPVLIGGAASATVPFIALAVREQGLGGAAKVTIVSAVFMIIFSVLQLGRHVAKVPHTVVSGFSCGIGAMMVISQLRTLTGIASPVDATSTNMLATLFDWLASIDQTRGVPLLIGGLAIVGSFAAARWSQRSPAPLIGVVAAVMITQFFGLREKEIGSLPLEIPAFAGFAWSPSDVYKVVPAGLGLAFVTSLNLLITSRVVEHFRAKHRPLKAADGDRELGAYGIANLCTGLFGAPLSVGIPARSLANVRCGGTTRLSNVIHAVAILAVLGLGTRFVEHIPIAALSGVIVYVGICLLDWGTWRRLPRMKHVDAAAFLGTAVAVLVVNALAAVVVGCSVYAVHHLYIRFTTPLNLQPARASD